MRFDSILIITCSGKEIDFRWIVFLPFYECLIRFDSAILRKPIEFDSRNEDIKLELCWL